MTGRVLVSEQENNKEGEWDDNIKVRRVIRPKAGSNDLGTPSRMTGRVLVSEQENNKKQ